MLDVGAACTAMGIRWMSWWQQVWLCHLLLPFKMQSFIKQVKYSTHSGIRRMDALSWIRTCSLISDKPETGYKANVRQFFGPFNPQSPEQCPDRFLAHTYGNDKGI